MSKFERIAREPLVMGGQACIRDTGITVNEIMRLSLDGSSQAEILQQFPLLEPEDVHQALGWNSEYVTNLVSGFLFELRGSSSTIKGYSQLMQMYLKNVDFNGKAEFGEWLTEILTNSERLQINLSDLRKWAGIAQRTGRHLEAQYIDWNALKLYIDDKIRNDLPVLNGHFLNQTKVISRTEPDELLFLLCTVRAIHSEETPNSKISFSKSDNVANFTIVNYGIDINSLGTSRDFEFVQLLIFDSNSELKIRQEENSVIFEFALPIVED